MSHFVKNFRAEKPQNRCPITLLIDDPSPCINPLYYFASQVPKDAVDYHYTKNRGKWYFDSDTEFKFPIAPEIDQEFVHEFAQWVNSVNVLGKISVVPFPAGLGRVDRKLAGFPRDRVTDFVSVFKNQIAKKFDIGPEMLTHTRALNLRTGKLTSGISEHDWSQKQNVETLTKYLSFALQILKSAGLKPSGVTSPCNFGMYVEDQYVRAVLNAGTSVLGEKVLWYFLNVDRDSQIVDHKIMYLDREGGEAVVSLMGSMNDPLWTAQLTDLPYDIWEKERINPVLSADGAGGRIAEQVRSGSYVTIVTHWQSLYSNGSRYGLKGLGELVSRVNRLLGDRILWMRCADIAQYVVCSASVSFSSQLISSERPKTKIALSSPFGCNNFTFSFEAELMPSEIFLDKEEGVAENQKLEKVSLPEFLKSNTWCVADLGSNGVKIFVCVAELREIQEKTIAYGVIKKTKRKVAKLEFTTRLVVQW
ncbi:MAG TPA: hypothetical protein VED17_07315 [Nitrososphaerales archaeon]|nr:hypothetical protein [Nitrososphaerales archaeon]